MKIYTSRKTTATKTTAMKVTLLALVCLFGLAQVPAFAQQTGATQTTPPPTQQDDRPDEVLRVSTSIVQTDVSVVDKQGKFVEGLQRDQFELKVDGKPQQVLFFERITAGGAGEAARLAAARGETATEAGAVTVARGRSVIFFVDDLHLSPAGILRARQVLLNFIEREMKAGTQVLIASASGQIGFLQQFTNEREVLRAAAGRLSYVTQASLDNERPTMSAYLATAIDRGDRDALVYAMRQMASTDNAVRLRASRIRRHAAQLSNAAVTALESVVRLRSPLPGRQTLFYISEGFQFDNQEADINYKLQRIADAAARSGTVVYTLDARGLSVGMESVDASSGVTVDSSLDGYNTLGELSASHEVLRALAADTGGRALLNTNALEAAVSRTLDETTNYYVLAWRPEGALASTDGAPKFRKIAIAVKGRPDLSVRVRRGFLNAPAGSASAAAAAAAAGRTTAGANPVKTALNAALNAPVARGELQVDVYPAFANDEQTGSVLLVPVQISNERLQFAAAAGGRRQATVEMACIVLDDKGKIMFSEGKTLTLAGDAAAGESNAAPVGGRGQLVTSFSVPVKAGGLYQVRVAARDSVSGRVGSAFRWVEAADFKAVRLALSSLFISEARQAAGADAAPEILKTDRRFARSSGLLLQFQIYHATRGASGGAPEAEVEIKVLDADNKAVMAAPPRRVSATPTGDPSRIPYAAEIPLGKMAAGTYWLQVTVKDARASATRWIDFVVR